MISSFRKFAKTKIAGVFVGIIILPFIFWGMGSMFSSGNVNNLAKIDNSNITTKEFVEYVQLSNISDQVIKENLEKNIIEELLSSLISSKLLELEIQRFNIIVSEDTLYQKIKKNKNFIDENNIFQRTKYEKFLLENNQTAVGFEKRLKKRESQKNLFDYVGAGIVLPNLLIKQTYKEENSKLNLEFINLNKFYKKDFTNEELQTFVNENKDDLKVEYIDFDYAIINPKNLIGINEFNQAFFDKIDQIEIDISNNIDFKTIINELDIEIFSIKDFKFSNDKSEIEKKIFELRNMKFDLFENGDDFVIYKIKSLEKKSPDLNDIQLKKEVTNLITQKNKFEFNKDLINKIQKNEFDINDFKELGEQNIEKITLNSVKDNKKFEINSVELLYSLPEDSFTLISDENNTIYLARINEIKNEDMNLNDEDLKQYTLKQNSKNKNSILKSYDLLLNDKYNVVLNQKTIERVKNFFK